MMASMTSQATGRRAAVRDRGPHRVALRVSAVATTAKKDASSSASSPKVRGRPPTSFRSGGLL
jgi:hypothetical protein